VFNKLRRLKLENHNHLNTIYSITVLFDFYMFSSLFLVVFCNRDDIYIAQVLNDDANLMFLSLRK